MITKLHLENFRAFQSFTLKDLNHITLIGGRNNSGKSAILESILLNFGISNPQIFYVLAALRNGAGPLQPSPDKIWTPLFFGYTRNNQLSIQTIRSNNQHSLLCIEKVPDDTAFFNINQDTVSNILNHGVAPYRLSDYFFALESSYTLAEQKISGRYNFTKDGIKYISKSPMNVLKGPLTKVLLYNNKMIPSSTSIAESFSQLNLHGQKEKIIQLLKIFDVSITDVSTVVDNGSPLLYVQFKDRLNMPLSMLGDGLNKAMQILLYILTTPNGIVLIDEIENGFHYSVYPKVLTAFYQAAILHQTQLIMTTHNIDILRTSVDILQERNQLSLLTYERIDTSQNGRCAFSFTGKELAHSLDAELEVR